jgi:SAM-dependent methyltransferase
MYNGKDLRGDTKYDLKSRLTRLNHVVDSIKNTEKYIVKMKKFYYKNVFLASEIILNDIDNKPYKNDGLIFTPMNEPYPTTKKWRSLLKWKPAELNTIDFYAVKVPDTNDWELYVQYTEPNSTLQHKPSKVLFDVSILCPDTSVNGITSRTTFDDYYIDPTTNEPYKSHTVIEFKYDTNTSSFLPIRTRWDKTVNPNKHGNHSTVACSIWDNIHNPVTKEMLINYKISENITTTEKNDFFFEKMRKFHNKIKESLYNKYTNNSEYLLELCSGKGGDLHKWKHNNIKHVYGYDICETSIKECRRRINESNYNINCNFYQLDLCLDNSWKTIQKHSNHYFNNISCQFGLHYFFQSNQTFDAFINILDNCLLQDGYFITTFMDDNEILNLTNNKLVIKEVDNQIVYYLHPQYDSSKLFGNKLRITLNGNNVLNIGSNEYIISYSHFVKTMENAGYILVDSKLFREISDLDISELSDIEKEISFLNRFCVFKKSRKPPNLT